MPTTIDNSTQAGIISYFGEGGGAYYGQTFVAAGYGMQDLTVYMTSPVSTMPIPPTKFHLLITTVEETESAPQPGRIINEISGLVRPADPGGAGSPITVDLSGVRLEKGETYAFILDARSAWDGTDDIVALQSNFEVYMDGTKPEAGRLQSLKPGERVLVVAVFRRSRTTLQFFWRPKLQNDIVFCLFPTDGVTPDNLQKPIENGRALARPCAHKSGVLRGKKMLLIPKLAFGSFVGPAAFNSLSD